MTVIEKAIHFSNLSDRIARELNKSLSITTAELSRKELEGQLHALCWARELVMREVENEQINKGIQEKEEE